MNRKKLVIIIAVAVIIVAIAAVAALCGIGESIGQIVATIT